MNKHDKYISDLIRKDFDSYPNYWELAERKRAINAAKYYGLDTTEMQNDLK